MSFSCHSAFSQTPFENDQENRLVQSKFCYPSHTKNRKSSTRDIHIKELFPVSKEIDYIPEFSDVNERKEAPGFLDQVLLSRISRKPSQDLGNRTGNHCYQLIAREYQFAFERIEIALQHKQTEVAKMKRQYEIEISEKQEVIEELKSVYEEELKCQDNNLCHLNSQIQKLEQKVKEQQVQIGVLKSEKQLTQSLLKRVERDHQVKMGSAEKTIMQLENALSELNAMLSDKNNRISEIEKLSLISGFSKETEKLASTITTAGDSLEQNLMRKYKAEIESHKSTQRHLLAKISVHEHQIMELKQYKLSYLQSSALLDQNLKVTTSMMSQVDSLKQSLRQKSEKEQRLRAVIEEQKTSLSRYSFENTNLNSYNKVLLVAKEEKPKQNIYAMSRLKRQNSLAATKLFS